jgi:hypothetical protein
MINISKRPWLGTQDSSCAIQEYAVAMERKFRVPVSTAGTQALRPLCSVAYGGWSEALAIAISDRWTQHHSTIMGACS